jgi:hypothetical protein
VAIELDEELSAILSDLERIGEIVAQKEEELGIVRRAEIARENDDCYVLSLNSRRFYLNKAQFETLFAQMSLIAAPKKRA